MSRARILSWGLSLILVAQANARQWTESAKPSTLPAPVTPASQQTTTQFRSIATEPATLQAATACPTTKPATPRSLSQPTAPAVIVEKRCPDVVNIGSKLNYEIVVRNVGTIGVNQVRVDDELPAGTKYVTSEPAAESAGDKLTWTIGEMPAGSERKIKVEVQPGTEGELRSTALVSFSTSTAMKTQVVCPKLAVTCSAPDQVLSGDAVPLQIQVTNPGSGSLQQLMLRVKLPANLQHPNGNYIEAELGMLGAGEMRTVPLKVTANGAGPANVEVTAMGNGVTDAVAHSELQLMQPKLAIRRVGPMKVYFKGEITEEIEIANPGNAPTANISVVEILPVGLEFLGASDGGTFDATSRAVTWKLGQAPAGARRTVALKTKAVLVGDQVTRAVATADRGLDARTEGMVAVEGIPAITVEVAALDDPVEVNGEMTYEVRVFNRGSCATTNIQVQCFAPDGLAPMDVTGPSAGHVTGQQITFDALSKLATKADAVYRIKCRAQRAGDYRFKVQLICDQLQAPVNKEEASRVYQN